VTGLQGSGGHCLGVKWPKLSFSEGHHDGHGVVAKYSISEVILIDPQRLGYLCNNWIGRLLVLLVHLSMPPPVSCGYYIYMANIAIESLLVYVFRSRGKSTT
jgi:hypothetical protein